jgi:hypothetical protein
MKLVAGVTVGIAMTVLTGAGMAFATPEMVSQAKKAGFPASNCQYCHTEAVPKKETFKPDALNDRGKFLMTDMQKRNLKAPDVSKLKEYTGAK